jgi:hypothetical protein
MKISHSKLATAVKTGYVHSGKVDRDYHAPVGSNETKKRVCRNVKKKQNRLLDKMMGED